MDITQFTRMMHQKGAQQVIIAPNVPMRIYAGDKWQQTNLFTPSEHVINTMLQNCMPPNLQGTWRQNDVAFSFPYATAADQYEVQVQSVSGSRTVTITDTGASPPSTLAPPLSATPSPLTASPSSASSSLAPPLKASSQIAREMGKGSVNITPPSTPSAPSPAPAPRTPAAPAPGTSAPTPPAYGTPPVLPEMAWHYAVNGRQFGPIPQPNLQAAIAQGLLTAETMVWREGMPDWAMAKLTELEPLFRSQSPIPTPHPSLPRPEWHHNNSGSGWGIEIPREIKGKWNWGAFLIPGFWAFAHGLAPVGILFLLSGAIAGSGLLGSSSAIIWILLFVGSLIMGAIGNDLAWSFRQFDDLEEFSQVQRIWGWWGVGIQLTFFLLSFFAATAQVNQNSHFD